LFQIECQQFGQEFIIAEPQRPAVGGEDGGVEFLVGEVEPSGALVVEVGEVPLFEFLGALVVFGNEAGIADSADSFPLSPWERAGVRVLAFLAVRREGAYVCL